MHRRTESSARAAPAAPRSRHPSRRAPRSTCRVWRRRSLATATQVGRDGVADRALAPSQQTVGAAAGKQEGGRARRSAGKAGGKRPAQGKHPPPPPPPEPFQPAARSAAGWAQRSTAGGSPCAPAARSRGARAARRWCSPAARWRRRCQASHRRGTRRTAVATAGQTPRLAERGQTRAGQQGRLRAGPCGALPPPLPPPPPHGCHPAATSSAACAAAPPAPQARTAAWLPPARAASQASDIAGSWVPALMAAGNARHQAPVSGSQLLRRVWQPLPRCPAVAR